MTPKKKNISDYFQLRPIKSAKVSEISEATAGSAVPAADRVNFHIGHPVQDKNLTRLYFKLATGLDAPPYEAESDEEIARLEKAGWEIQQTKDIHFLNQMIGHLQKMKYKLIRDLIL